MSAFKKLGFAKSIKKTKDNAVRSNGIVDSNNDGRCDLGVVGVVWGMAVPEGCAMCAYIVFINFGMVCTCTYMYMYMYVHVCMYV